MRSLPIIFLAAAAGCTPIMEATTHDPARRVIASAVEDVAETPDIAARITDCVVIHATNTELIRIAADATKLQGPAPDIAQLIGEIMARPETRACVAI